jgi:hypothetical protein
MCNRQFGDWAKNGLASHLATIGPGPRVLMFRDVQHIRAVAQEDNRSCWQCQGWKPYRAKPRPSSPAHHRNHRVRFDLTNDIVSRQNRSEQPECSQELGSWPKEERLWLTAKLDCKALHSKRTSHRRSGFAGWATRKASTPMQGLASSQFSKLWAPRLSQAVRLLRR